MKTENAFCDMMDKHQNEISQKLYTLCSYIKSHYNRHYSGFNTSAFSIQIRVYNTNNGPDDKTDEEQHYDDNDIKDNNNPNNIQYTVYSNNEIIIMMRAWFA